VRSRHHERFRRTSAPHRLMPSTLGIRITSIAGRHALVRGHVHAVETRGGGAPLVCGGLSTPGAAGAGPAARARARWQSLDGPDYRPRLSDV
jgi:hypothetical protein